MFLYSVIMLAVAILTVFLCIGIVCICVVQQKYNGGMF